jgi:hypothetical protein
MSLHVDDKDVVSPIDYIIHGAIRGHNRHSHSSRDPHNATIYNDSNDNDSNDNDSNDNKVISMYNKIILTITATLLFLILSNRFTYNISETMFPSETHILFHGIVFGLLFFIVLYVL